MDAAFTPKAVNLSLYPEGRLQIGYMGKYVRGSDPIGFNTIEYNNKHDK